MKIRAELIKTQPGGIFIMKALPDSHDDAKAYFLDIFRKQKDGKKVIQEIDMKKWYKKRTLSQNALLFALCEIISKNISEHFADAEDIYYEICQKYAPRRKGEIIGEEVPIRGSQMTTMEFSSLINGAFYEISMLNISPEGAISAHEYWKDFIEYRYDQETDPLEISSIEEYREKVSSCEASGKFLGHYGEDDYCGQIAHIKSAGSGGELSPDNVLHLHAHIHVPEQHQHGWFEFLEKYPHLRKKVEKALGHEVKAVTMEQNASQETLRTSGNVLSEELDIF